MKANTYRIVKNILECCDVLLRGNTMLIELWKNEINFETNSLEATELIPFLFILIYFTI